MLQRPTAGTERCAQAAEELGEAYDLVVNIQGDEPLIDPAIINACVHALQASPDAVYRHELPPAASLPIPGQPLAADSCWSSAPAALPAHRSPWRTRA